MKYKVNLLPRELQPKPPPSGTRLALIGMVTILVCAMLGAYAAFIMDYQAKLQLKTPLQQQLTTSQAIKSKIKQINDEQSAVAEKTAAQQAILSQSLPWSLILEKINHHLPVGVYLTSINLTTREDNEQTAPPVLLVLSGVSNDLANIGQVLNNLQQLHYFQWVSLDWAKETAVNETSKLTFQITAQVAGDEND